MVRRLPLLAFVVLMLAAPAAAQTGQGGPANGGVGERYWIEFSAALWRPTFDGSISSDRLGVIGSRLDFVSDLGLQGASLTDFRLVLRPAKKHRFRFQYTPIALAGDSVLTRDITFMGQVYPVSLPVQSRLTWTVLRVGYEWDFFYRPRGFVGVVLEVRQTTLTAGIDSILGGGEIMGTAPLPAIGFVGRAYPIRHLAINVEGTGLKLTDRTPEHAFETFDLDVSATYNFTRNVGVSGGWRRVNTSLTFDTDHGDLNFKGLWFGGVVRY